MMPLLSPRRALLPAAIVCSLVVGSVIANTGIDHSDQDRHQASFLLQQTRQQGGRDPLGNRRGTIDAAPLEEHDIAVLRKLISGGYIRLSGGRNKAYGDDAGNSRHDSRRRVTAANQRRGSGSVPGLANAVGSATATTTTTTTTNPLARAMLMAGETRERRSAPRILKGSKNGGNGQDE
jgi:hypothetical protein